MIALPADDDGAGGAPPARSPLHAQHEALGATMTAFAGYSMPVRYTSDIAEHEAVRSAAGLFDVSHMGEIYVTGPEAPAALAAAVTGRLDEMGVGRAKYTFLAAPDGGILDDLIVYRLLDDNYLVVANAGNARLVARELAERCADFDCAVADASVDMSLIAIQGPRAADSLAGMTGRDERVSGMKYYSSVAAVIEGTIPVTIARTGYTGEDGFEVFCAAADAVAVWDSALHHGTPVGLQACGLAARDSLRLEAGMPLHGAEITPGTDPFQAGLGWAVALQTAAGDAREFVGAAALRAAKSRVAQWRESPGDAPADARVLVGLAGDGRRAARAGYALVDADGSEVGVVTSGAPSPTLSRPIALAHLHPRFAGEGTAIEVDVRGRREPMSVVPLPFYSRTQ